MSKSAFLASVSTAVLVMGAVLALGAGCPGTTGEGEGEGEGGAGEGEGEGEGGGTPEEQVVNAFGDFFNRCLFGSGFEAQAEPTELAVLGPQEIAGIKAAFLAELQSPNVTIDDSKAAACVAALESLSCDEISAAEPQACVDFAQGKLAANASCASDLECQPGLGCFGITNGCGTCVAKAALNGDCSNAPCESGLECDTTGATSTCVNPPPPVATGDHCDDTAGTFCTTQGDTCVNNVCTASSVVQVGQKCDQDSKHCVDEGSKNICLPDSGAAGTSTCTARPGLNQACVDVPLCDNTVAVCTNGTCTDAGKSGDTCADTVAEPCQIGLVCSGNSTCESAVSFPAPATCP